MVARGYRRSLDRQYVFFGCSNRRVLAPIVNAIAVLEQRVRTFCSHLTKTLLGFVYLAVDQNAIDNRETIRRQPT